MLAAVHHAAYADQVTDLKFADQFANGRDPADDLVTRHRRVNSVVPFIARGVQIRMADAAVQDVKRDIKLTGRTALKRKGCQRSGGRNSGITVSCCHIEA